MNGYRIAAALVAVLGTMGLGGLVFFALLMESFAFDSPNRVTSTEKVFGLLEGGSAGLLAFILLLAGTLAVRGGGAGHPATRPLAILTAVAGLLGGGAFAASVGLAFFGK
jgi:hypothetical protein